jgi:Uma2 family endonuclease
MSTVQATPAKDQIIYPDCDGEPIAENTLQFDWIMTIKGGLDTLFMDRPDVFVAGDLLWYPIEGDNKTRTAPDAMVVFGRPKGPRGSYMQWEEGGIAPQVVFEVLSPGNRSGEMGRKLEFYEEFGVEEYYQYDPDREPRPGGQSPLRGWIRSEGRLIEIPKMPGFVSPRLGIRFELGAGKDALTIHHPDGRPFIGFVEQVEQTNAERLRANEERQRADEAAARARAAEQQAQAERRRADALMAQLRAMGIEPEI